MHTGESEGRGSDVTPPDGGYFRAAYAVTSNVTATSSNFGFVQVMVISSSTIPTADLRPEAVVKYY